MTNVSTSRLSTNALIVSQRNTVGGLLFLLLFFLVGCDSSSKETVADADTTSDKPVSANGSPTVDSSVEFLINAGLTLRRGRAGDVLDVHAFDVEVTDEMAEHISNLSTLTKLMVKKSAMSLAGWEALGKLSNLQQLDVRDCELGNEELVAAVKGMPKLRALRMSGKSGSTTVDDNGLAALAACPDLKALFLDHLWIGEAGIENLSSNSKLSELYLASTTVDDNSMQAVANLTSLTKLRLAQTTISAAGLQQIVELPLVELDISECSQIFDDAMLPVGKLTELTRLNLWRDAVTDQGVSQLRELTKLKWLNLDATQLTDVGLPHLKGMLQLEFLHLGSTSVTDDGMNELLGLASLKDLKVTRTAVTEDGVKLVTNAIPSVDVQLEYIEGQ